MALIIRTRSLTRSGFQLALVSLALLLSLSTATSGQSYPGLPRVDQSIAPTVEPSISVEGAPNSFVPLQQSITNQETAPRVDLNQYVPLNQTSPTPIELTPQPTQSILPQAPIAQVPNAFVFDSGDPGTLFQWNHAEKGINSSESGGPLVTDRPDFTEASSTVGLGIAQLEFGYTYTFDNDGTTQTITNAFGEPLLRYGVLAEWLELRLGYNYFTQETNGVQVSGSDDLYLGFKIGLTPQEGILPEMALIPQMRVPTGKAPFTANQVLPGLNWIYGWELTDRLSTAGSTQFNLAKDGTNNTYTQWAQSWTLAYSWTDKLGSYAETFGLMPQGAVDTKPEYYFNGGFTYLLNDNIQWDIRAGTGLNDAAADYFLGSGFSVRYGAETSCNR